MTTDRGARIYFTEAWHTLFDELRRRSRPEVREKWLGGRLFNQLTVRIGELYEPLRDKYGELPY